MQHHPQARFIVETLQRAGHFAYYAGGWVRDYLLNHPSDDIDIATSATPPEIQSLFPRTVPIGLAFGIILVIVEGHQFEVATFRQDLGYHDGRRPHSIAFSSPEEDAKRRDFTINGMFYDPIADEIYDYVGGQADLAAGLIRAIGDPHERISEDRLRMIRGVRLACRFGFQIEKKTEEAIRAHAKELFPAVAIERVVQELTKGHASGVLRKILLQLHAFGLLSTLFPDLAGIDIAPLLVPVGRYPKKGPLIASLLALFPAYGLEKQLELCKYLKLSNVDQQFTTFLFRARELIQTDLQNTRPVENVEWAYLYANAFCPQTLQIISAHLDAARAAAFLEEHQARMDLLHPAIERIQAHNPVVKSGDLQKAGVAPGKAMGLLLREAEQIAFNERIYTPEPIVERLRQSPHWPQVN